MNIKNVNSFLCINRCGNYGKAAGILGISQPSLTSRIQTLERDLNVTLFTRVDRRVVLTEAGRTFLPYAVRMVNLYHQTVHALHPGKEELRIGANNSVAETILPRIIPIFAASHAHVAIKLVTGSPEYLMGELHGHNCDLLFSQRIPDDSVRGIPFYRDPISLVVPTGHAFHRSGQAPTMQEIALEPLIKNIIPDTSDYWSELHRLFELKNAVPNIVLNVDSIDTTKKMILQGVGISFLPELAVEQELDGHTLHIVTPSPPLRLYRNIELLYRVGAASVYIDTFIEILNEHVRQS